jgi:hypothetical protein
MLKRCEVPGTHTQKNAIYSTEHIQTEVSIVYCKGNKYMNERHGGNYDQKCIEGLQSQLIRPNHHGL